MKKRMMAILMAAIMAAGMTACGSSGSSSDSSGETASASTEAASEAEEDASEDAAAENVIDLNSAEAVTDTSSSVERESLTVAYNEDPQTLAPWAGSASGVIGQLYMVYESLFSKQLGGDLEPCLAKDYTADGDTLTVNLFDYIVDSNGNPFTAQDAVWCLDQCIAEGNVSYVRIIDSYEAPDDYTLILHLTSDVDSLSAGDLDDFFTNVYFVTQASYEAAGDGMFQNAVGTGRYTVESFTPDSELVFKKRDDYWQTDEQYIAARSVANVDTLTLDYVADASQRAIAVETGAADVGMGIAYTDYDSVEAADGIHVYSYQMSLTKVLLGNCSDNSICSDINMRMAIYYALDNAGLAAMFTEGTATPVLDMANANYPDYYEDYYQELADEGDIYSYDVEKAKEYLAKTSYNGESLQLITDTQHQQLSESIQAYLAEVGINIEINVYSSDLLTSYAEDETGWDLYLRQTASNSYATIGWMRVFTQKFYNGHSCNFIVDDKLQNYIDTVTTEAGHTEEAVKEAYKYIVDNAYGYGLYVAMSYMAVPDDTVSVVMNSSLMPSFAAWVFE